MSGKTAEKIKKAAERVDRKYDFGSRYEAKTGSSREKREALKQK